MFYGECTAAYAVEVIKEILTNIDSEREALGLVHAFMDGELSTDEIAGVIDGRG